MLIDTSRHETFPLIIEETVKTYIDNLPQDVLKKIVAYPVQYSNDVNCAIEAYISSYKAEYLYQEILPIMEQCGLIAFHATRLTSREGVYHTGLKAINWSWYGQMISQYLYNCGIYAEDVNKALSLIKQEYDRKYKKYNPLFLFSSVELVNTKDMIGYGQFCRNIGGELAKWALNDKMPEVYEVLKQGGEPVIIKLWVPFTEIDSHQKNSIIYSFICNSVARYFWNFNYPIHFDCSICSDVTGDRIIEVISYTEEIY